MTSVINVRFFLIWCVVESLLRNVMIYHLFIICIRLFNEMQQLMDPSRNMSRYRNLVNGEDVQPPIVPFYPVVKKDLTFIHLANDTKIDELVNFEKLRMIAKEVRGLINMCSAPLDLFSMLELGGQQPSNAMVAMNQLTTGGQNLATVNRRRKKQQGVPNPKRMFEEVSEPNFHFFFFSLLF